MKKFYLLSVLLALFSSNLFAQGCLVDAALAPNAGIYPPAPGYVDASRLVVMPNANEGSPYDQTAQIKVPTDTIVDTLGLQLVAVVDSMKIFRVDGLPSGINYNCDNGDCKWLGGDNGCVRFSGTPTTGGLYLADIVAIGYATLPVIGAAVDTFNYRRHLFVDVPLSLEQPNLEQPVFFPNPATSSVTIQQVGQFKQGFDLQLYNLQGQVVLTQTFAPADAVTVPLQNLKAGLYVYQIQAGQQIYTDFLVVNP